ncbi:MAG: transposase domain-containing protein [Isosphaeraceae bacterium]
MAGGGGEEGPAEEPGGRSDRLHPVEPGGADPPSESAYPRIDNNATENAIRPIALGRKNWLHLGSDRGGRTAATLLSLVQSCKNLGNEPFAYLRDVLGRVSTHPNSRVGDLLPDRRVLPGPAGDRKDG